LARLGPLFLARTPYRPEPLSWSEPLSGPRYRAQREIEIMQMVKHKNVIALFEIYDEPKKMHLVMELVRGICVGRTSCLFV
jgi:serine/threonine protein kinase